MEEQINEEILTYLSSFKHRVLQGNEGVIVRDGVLVGKLGHKEPGNYEILCRYDGILPLPNLLTNNLIYKQIKESVILSINALNLEELKTYLDYHYKNCLKSKEEFIEELKFIILPDERILEKRHFIENWINKQNRKVSSIIPVTLLVSIWDKFNGEIWKYLEYDEFLLKFGNTESMQPLISERNELSNLVYLFQELQIIFKFKDKDILPTIPGFTKYKSKIKKGSLHRPTKEKQINDFIKTLLKTK